jgi:hypothetical protein
VATNRLARRINPYGTFHIDMSTHLDLGPETGEAEAA